MDSNPWASNVQVNEGRIAPELRDRLRVLREQDYPRLCSDIPCLAFQVLHACVVIALVVVAWSFRNPSWLQTGWDYRARACGIDGGVNDRNFVYWPFPDRMSMGLCVRRCPDISDFERALKIQVPEAEPLMKQQAGYGSSLNITFSQAVRLKEVHVYPTVAAIGRFCIPAPETRTGLVQTPLPGNADGGKAPSGLGSGEVGPQSMDLLHPLAKDTVLPALLASLGGVDPQLRRTAGGLQQVHVFFFSLLLVIPVISGLLPVYLAAHRSALPAMWALTVSLGAGSLGLGMHLLVYWGFSDSAFEIDTLNNLQHSSALLFGVGLSAVGLGVLLIGLCFRDELRWTAACAEAAAAVVFTEGLATPLIIVCSMIATLQILVSIFGVILLESAASGAKLNWPPEVPATISRSPGTESDALAEIIPGGPLVRGLIRQPNFLWGMIPLVLMWVLVLKYVLAVVACFGHFLVAYVVTRWYFSDPLTATMPLWRRVGKNPTRTACAIVLGVHSGGVAAAAVLHTACFPVVSRALCVLLHKFFAPWWKSSSRCPTPFGSCFAGIQTLLGSAPCAEVAMFAGHFHNAVTRSTRALSRSLPATQFLAGMPSILEGVACGFAWFATCSSLLLVRLWHQPHNAPGYVETEVVVSALAGFLAVPPTSAALSILTSSFDALLECFMCDDAFHDLPDENFLGHGGWSVSVDASYALWSSGHAPQQLRSLIFEASQSVQRDMAQGAGRRAHNFKDVVIDYAYAPIAAGAPPGVA